MAGPGCQVLAQGFGDGASPQVVKRRTREARKFSWFASRAMGPAVPIHGLTRTTAKVRLAIWANQVPGVVLLSIRRLQEPCTGLNAASYG